MNVPHKKGDYRECLRPACRSLGENLDLVELLVRNPDRVISKDEIIDQIWDGRIISEAALSSCIRLARQALNDDGSRQDVIKTLHGIGFRFVADHEVIADQSPAVVGDQSVSQIPAPQNESDGQPSIAILPFQLIGSDPLQTPIAEALPAELITTLSRLRWLKVLARGSTFRLSSDAEDPAKFLNSIGATYAVHGIVEKRDNVVSASVTLSDVRSNAIAWLSDGHGADRGRSAEACADRKSRCLGVLPFGHATHVSLQRCR